MKRLLALTAVPAISFATASAQEYFGQNKVRYETYGFNTTAQKRVSSYGASLRVNLLGFAIGQISYIHSNDRPAKDWVWQFSFLPGF